MAEEKAPTKERTFDTYETVVEQADLITPRNIHLRFRLPEGKRIKFKAGQFVQVFIPRPDKPRRTSYSIASVPHETEFVELCVTLVDGGASSTYLHSLKPGQKIILMGPLGMFTQPKPLPRDTVFIATGSGIAPFRSMIGNFLEEGTDKQLYLLYGNRFDQDIIYQKEWESKAATHPNLHVFFTLSRPTEAWKGSKGYVQDKIAEFIAKPADKDFYICGLTNMINGVQEKLLALGVPRNQIHYEKYD